MIGPEEAARLRRASPYNAVHLVLPEEGGPEGHGAAAGRLRAWLAEGILREDAPAVYVLRQAFTDEGGSGRERRGLLAALRLVPFGDGRVLPHEETHRGPREDRLGLTLAARAQLSPVFLVAGDADGTLARLVEEADRGAGTGTASSSAVLEAPTGDGVEQRLVRVAAGRTAERLCEAAAREPLLIADGHHRYETALAVADRLPDLPRARRVLACIVSESDPGLAVHPTHRALAVPPPEGGWEAALREDFELERLDAREAVGAPEAALRTAGAGPGALALLDRSAGLGWLLRPRTEALRRAEALPEEGRVASVALERLVLRRRLETDAERAARAGVLSYHRDPEDAWRAAGAEGAAFLLSPVRPEDVRSVARCGRRLPPKSTYFAPKVPSGLLFRRLE